jgi:GT2 family glycosyltransferase
MVSVTIVIANYNGRKYLKKCISSLYKQTYKDFEIILVDNASKDDSIVFVKNNFPKVKIIQNKKNLGFSGGNNLGVKFSKGRYIFFVSQDTETDKNCLKELMSCIKKSKDTIACPKILLSYERNKINATGLALHYLGYGWCDNLGKPSKEQNEEREILFPSGTAFLIDKKIFNSINGFDEIYFAYYEDTDLGWRLRLKNYKVMLVPKAKLYHQYIFSRHSIKIYFAERNRIVTILKNYETKTLFLILPPLMLTEAGVLFYSSVNGLLSSKLSGYYWIIKNMSKILKRRKSVQKYRKVTDKEIVKYFFSKIEFKEIPIPLIEHSLNPVLDVYWKIIKRFI